jgi:hypothetical protein
VKSKKILEVFDEGECLPPLSFPWVEVYLLMSKYSKILYYTVPSSVEKEVVKNLIIEGNIHNIT